MCQHQKRAADKALEPLLRLLPPSCRGCLHALRCSAHHPNCEWCIFLTHCTYILHTRCPDIFGNASNCLWLPTTGLLGQRGRNTKQYREEAVPSPPCPYLGQGLLLSGPIVLLQGLAGCFRLSSQEACKTHTSGSQICIAEALA